MPEPEQTPEREVKRPVHTIRLGYVQAAIWQNDTEHGPSFGITLERLYRDQEENWRSTRTFRPGDLPTLIQVLTLAVADFYHRRSDPWEEGA